MSNPLYNWQKNTITVIVLTTSIALLYNDRGNGGDGHFRTDLFFSFVFAIGINVLVWWLIFKGLNWIYDHIKK
jgi:ABC-type sugar transport system permease subunit